jgi:hypothetical protein
MSKVQPLQISTSQDSAGRLTQFRVDNVSAMTVWGGLISLCIRDKNMNNITGYADMTIEQAESVAMHLLSLISTKREGDEEYEQMVRQV